MACCHSNGYAYKLEILGKTLVAMKVGLLAWMSSLIKPQITAIDVNVLFIKDVALNLVAVIWLLCLLKLNLQTRINKYLNSNQGCERISHLY